MVRFFIPCLSVVIFIGNALAAVTSDGSIPVKIYQSVPQGLGRYQAHTFPSGRGARWGYPQDFIDGPYLESDYQITGLGGVFYDDVYTFTIYRPSFFSLSYPFNVPEGWKVVDGVTLGVTPPPLPNYIENIKYKGYWYGCPKDLDMYNPLYWRNDENRFTNFCQYFYYY